MINISASLNLPLVTFSALISKHIKLMTNYVLELEINRTTSLIGLTLVTRPWGDHRGFDIGCSLLFVDVMISLYDTRHDGQI